MYVALKSNGVLVTYAAKRSGQKSMIEVGFTLKVAGPPGKEKCLEHVKIINCSV
jgi:tRNA U34 5-methylaminomethyl-2-thiouridine-forming methyltransferase MnmC